MGNVIQGGFAPIANPGFPWNPWGEHKDVSFYCHKLGLDDLVLTTDINKNGDYLTYYVYSRKDPTKRTYPVFPDEIVLADSKEAKIAASNKVGLFEINLANISQIKDFFLTQFIPSYNWESEDQKAEMISRVKRPRDGLHREIETVRLQGSFQNKEDFVTRMSKQIENFPWAKFSEFIDYKLPSA